MHSEPWKPVIRHLADSLTQDPTAQVVEGILQDLTQLEDFFKAHSSDQDGDNIRSYALNTISLSAYFALLASNHRPLVTKVTKVIHYLVLPVSYQVLDRDYTEYLVEGLQHPNPTVQRLVLAQLSKYTPTEGPFAGKYVPWVMLLLKSSDALVVKETHDLLVSLGRTMDNLHTLLCPENIETLMTILKDSSVRFRIYDVFVAIALTSEQALQYCADHAVFNQLFQEATSSDLLCRLGALNVYRT
ncbi:26S proteasome non-ATPase regulatory subunit 5, partial [Dimargaris verticillata]